MNVSLLDVTLFLLLFSNSDFLALLRESTHQVLQTINQEVENIRTSIAAIETPASSEISI